MFEEQSKSGALIFTSNSINFTTLILYPSWHSGNEFILQLPVLITGFLIRAREQAESRILGRSAILCSVIVILGIVVSPELNFGARLPVYYYAFFQWWRCHIGRWSYQTGHGWRSVLPGLTISIILMGAKGKSYHAGTHDYPHVVLLKHEEPSRNFKKDCHRNVISLSFQVWVYSVQ